jgi:hypothetical protein
VKQILKSNKEKKDKKYHEFAAANLSQINGLLQNNMPNNCEELTAEIVDFLNSAVRGEACELKIPANFNLGLLSLLLSNMALWVGNTQQSLRTKGYIKNLEG